MILKHFPDVTILYIKDVESDEAWSNQLDNNILDIASPTSTITLYGSRDSFINYYTGRFETKELKQVKIF